MSRTATSNPKAFLDAGLVHPPPDGDVMDIAQNELEARAVNLPPEARARLAGLLLASLEDDPGVTTTWLDESRRRDVEIAGGLVAEVPAREAFARAWGRVSTGSP